MQKVYKLHLDVEIMNSFRVAQKKVLSQQLNFTKDEEEHLPSKHLCGFVFVEPNQFGIEGQLAD